MMGGLRRPTLGRVFATTLAAGLIAAAVSAQDFGDPRSIAWKFAYGLSDADYARVREDYEKQGFLPIDIGMDNGGASYSGVWQRNTDGRAWVSWRRLTSAQFRTNWDVYRRKGYRPIHQGSEVIGGQLLYSLIMVENKEGLGWISNRGLTGDQFAEAFAEHSPAYRPVDIAATEVNGRTLYSSIWLENRSKERWAEQRDMTAEDYAQKFAEYRDQGYRVAHLACYERNHQLAYAAIWEHNGSGRAWAALRQMSVQSLRNNWHTYADQGMRIVDVAACPAVGGAAASYAAVWRENDDRHRWTGRAQAEVALSMYAGNRGVPGVGAAIVRNGRVLFRAGSGFADRDNDITAHSGTIYRLASIAKAVTGTLAYDLEDAGIIDLDSLTGTILPGLGSEHHHTVRQLLQNRGCVKHYTADQFDDNATQVQYATAQSALASHMNGAMKTNAWIIAGCSPGTWNYSTHGYTIAAAALEVRANTSFANLIKTRIADPSGLDTLRAEVRHSPDSSSERATINAGTTKVSDTQFENVSWKAAGSGMESSALDLALFGDAVLRNRYFPQATRNRMWSGGTNAGQANGWTMNAGATQIFKSGDNQGANSHIRIDVASGITVVALTNTDPPPVDTSVLTQQLLTIALAHP